ncbi:MAG: VanZ family protein [Flavobacteriaceae bacterium]|nr:VanZ family protein [Flavobacteriaceae bacterium]
MPHTKHLLGHKTLLLIAVCYSCAITILFFIPSPDLPKLDFSAADKIVHSTIYFILINLWMYYFYAKNGFPLNVKQIMILLFSILLYGIIIEILQGLLTVSRTADIFDVAANLLGTLLGIFFFRSIKKHLKI